MKINLIKIFLLGAIVNVVYAEMNFVYEELLKNPSSCFLQCLSIEGYEKDKKNVTN